MNTWLLVVFLVYMLVMIAIAYFVSRKQKTGEGFLLANRNVPFLLSLGTTVATMVGTGSSMGAVGYAYTNGWAGALYGIGGATGILLLAWLFAPVRALKFTTMSEELAHYVNDNAYVKNVLACVIYAACLGWLGAHIIGGGLYLSWLTGLSPTNAKLTIALGFSIYVIIGGYSAVVWTDSLQAIILFIGFIAMAYFALDYAGGLSAILDAQPVANISLFAFEKIGVIPAISLVLAIMVGVLATPSFRQRIYTGKNIASIRRSFVLSGVLYLSFAIVPAIIGMSAFAIKPNLDQAAFAFPHIALNVMPISLGVFIIIAGISATLSSASSDAIAGVSILISDIYQAITKQKVPPRQSLLWSRVGLVFSISFALILALISNNIITYITQMIAVLMSGMCVFGFLGRLWPRYNWQGALATLIASMVSALLVGAIPSWQQYLGNAIIPALASAFIAGIAVTILTSNTQQQTHHPKRM